MRPRDWHRRDFGPRKPEFVKTTVRDRAVDSGFEIDDISFFERGEITERMIVDGSNPVVNNLFNI